MRNNTNRRKRTIDQGDAQNKRMKEALSKDQYIKKLLVSKLEEEFIIFLTEHYYYDKEATLNEHQVYQKFCEKHHYDEENLRFFKSNMTSQIKNQFNIITLNRRALPLIYKDVDTATHIDLQGDAKQSLTQNLFTAKNGKSLWSYPNTPERMMYQS